MKTKYMSLIKKVIICLVILLFVVCFSLSSSFSSFIFESNDHRAVEMIANKLSYSIKINNVDTNKITIKPGGNVINISIKSLNKVDTYYKLMYQNNDSLVVYNLSNNISGIINNEEKNIKLLVINKDQNTTNCSFEVFGGYITRSLDEIIALDNYNEIDRSLAIGDYIEYSPSNNYELDGKYFNAIEPIKLSTINTKWQVYDINDKGEIIIISEDNIILNSDYKLKGSIGYNNAVNLLNDISRYLYSSDNSVEVRNINLEDIESKLNKSLVRYGENLEYLRSISSIYYPTLWEYEKNSVINNESTNGEVGRSEGYIFNDVEYKQVNQIVVKDLIVDETINGSDSYLLSTRYVKGNDNVVEWGIYKIENGKLELKPLYDSSGNETQIPFSIRPIVKLSPNYLAN